MTVSTLDTEKWCHTCDTTKALHDFYLDKRRDKFSAECRVCHKDRNNRRNKAKREELGPEAFAESQLLNKYGMTLRDYQAMLDSQNGGCAICKRKAPGHGATRFCVDHDHACCPSQKTCGKCIRGLLCHPCNAALGILQDSPEVLISAAQYLMSFDTSCSTDTQATSTQPGKPRTIRPTR